MGSEENMDAVRSRIVMSGILFFAAGMLLQISDGDRAMANGAGLDVDKYAVVTWNAVGSPLGTFLLIRKGQDTCAIRFTEARRGGDVKPPTTVNSGDESFSAEYDWYYQGDGSGDVTARTAASGRKKLDRRPLRGIGRLAFQAGESEVKCGPFSLPWTYPTLVRLYAGDRRGDQGIEMAPTKWSSIEQLQPRNAQLEWYSYDEKRPDTHIPITALPPSSDGKPAK